MGQRSGGRAQKIEHEKTEMPERVLDIVAEDPEEKHVHGEMHEIAMQKGVGDEGEFVRNDHQRGIEVGIIEDDRGDIA